jgi:hypothetical protein
VGASAELELEPIHSMTIKQLVYEPDETRPEPHAKVQAGFSSVAGDAKIRSDERKKKPHTRVFVRACSKLPVRLPVQKSKTYRQ